MAENADKISFTDKGNSKIVKVFDMDDMKEGEIVSSIQQNNGLLSDMSLPFVIPSQIQTIGDNLVICERPYYKCDLKEIIYNKSLSEKDVRSIMASLSNILMILSEYGVDIYSIKSSNIVYDSDDDNYENPKICDLWLNMLRKKDNNENIKIDDICYLSYEELCGKKCNEKSVMWSVGCVLFEILNKRLPFCEDDDMNKTLNNIMKCKLSDDINVDDDEMKEILFRMLKVESEDRLSLSEFNKEMIKESEILKDSENHLMIVKERKEVLYESDNLIIKLPITFNEKVVIKQLKMKFEKNDSYKREIKGKQKFILAHKCKYSKEKRYLDGMMFNIEYDEYQREYIEIKSNCLCFCEVGIKYFFKILKEIHPTKLQFHNVYIPIRYQPLFGSCFSQLSDLQGLNMTFCGLTSHFVETFVQSIPSMKRMNFLRLEENPISSTGFKLLLPYLHLMIRDYELSLDEMNLNNEAVELLLSNYYKFANLRRISVFSNDGIDLAGLKSLFSKFSYRGVSFSYFNYKELLIDKSIPNYVGRIALMDILALANMGIDDDLFKTFFPLRSNDIWKIKSIYFYDNKLTSKSVEVMMKNPMSLLGVEFLQLHGNPIGDLGMKLLSSRIPLLKYYDHGDVLMNCSKMELSTEGFKYLLDGMKSIEVDEYDKVKLDISGNHIDSKGIEYFMKYNEENDKIGRLLIHDNPIGNEGFKLFSGDLEMLQDDYSIYLNLSNISIDDESAEVITDTIATFEDREAINLNGNNFHMNGLKLICEKSLEDKDYPFIQMNNSSWSNEELKYYLNYCIKKERKKDDYKGKLDLSNLNVNDSHISLIKQIDFKKLDLSNNKISSKGLKELTDSLPKDCKFISVCGNDIGDEGVEIISENIDKFIKIKQRRHLAIFKLSNVGMSEKGLKMLIEGLKDYEALAEMDISGNELNEEELIIMKENKEVFDCLKELSITVKENINKEDLKSFLETFSTVTKIKINE